MRFGIIGLGRFGRIWTQALLPFGEVMVYDKKNQGTHLQEAASADVVFLTVPISEIESCCYEIKPYLKPTSIIADCCSVKVYPVQVMKEVFSSSQAMVATHPLFGPDSVQKSGGLSGHKMVVCPLDGQQEHADYLALLFDKMGLTILMTTPEEHDRQMANSQSLVHFIGRGLASLNLKQQDLSTPDFQALLNINSIVMNDTWQLFLDMHRYNPYAREIRKNFLIELIKLEEEIEYDKT